VVQTKEWGCGQFEMIDYLSGTHFPCVACFFPK
jgi:hypothetical protein